MGDENDTFGSFDFPQQEKTAKPKELELKGRMGWPEAIQRIFSDLVIGAVMVSCVGVIYLLTK